MHRPDGFREGGNRRPAPGAVAADLVIAGSAGELARRLGVCVPTFRMALRELVGVGWVVVNEGPGGRLTVRWSGGGRLPAEGGQRTLN